MEKNKSIKIKIEELVLIFGKQQNKALKMLKTGESKQEVLKKTGCTVGVNSASFEVYEGEFFVIMGLSGSGKSTLLRCLNRLIEPTAGNVIINDENVTRKSHKELLDIRRTEMSMVFQNFGLLPHRTVLENAAFGLELRGEEQSSREKFAQEALDTVGLNGYEHQLPSQLSGGMKQRVGLARALANNPEVLLMDEAFSALDPLIKAEMQDELLALQDKLQKTVVFITHDLDEAIKLGDRIVIMKDGVIEQIGTAEEILTNPATEYVKAFVEKVDRKTIITAESLMHNKPTIVRLGKDGLKGTLRKMRETGLDALPVINEKRDFVGFVWVKDVAEAANKGTQDLNDILWTDKVPVTSKSATVEELLPLISFTRFPIAVIEDNSRRLLGLVSQNSVIIEATRFKEEELLVMKDEQVINNI